MIFSSPNNLKFQCKKCGGCCKQRSISLTEREITFLQEKIGAHEYSYEILNRKDMILYDVKFNTEKCLFLNDNLCDIYNERFMMCRLFPFDFTIFPDGQINVEIIYCNGVSPSNIDYINSQYIDNILTGLKKTDIDFYNKLVISRQLNDVDNIKGFTLFDEVSIEDKIDLRDKIKQLLDHPKLQKINPYIKIYTISNIYINNIDKIISEYLQLIYPSNYTPNPPYIFTNFDIEYILKQFIQLFNNKVNDEIINSKKIIQDNINKGKIENKIEINLGDSKEYKNLNDEIYTIDRNNNKIYFKMIEIIDEKQYTNESIQLFNNYIKDILSRYGRSGIPFFTSISEILYILNRVTYYLNIQSKIYAKEKNQIEYDDVLNAISFLDQKAIALSLSLKIMEIYRSDFLKSN